MQRLRTRLTELERVVGMSTSVPTFELAFASPARALSLYDKVINFLRGEGLRQL